MIPQAYPVSIQAFFYELRQKCLDSNEYVSICWLKKLHKRLSPAKDSILLGLVHPVSRQDGKLIFLQIQSIYHLKWSKGRPHVQEQILCYLWYFFIIGSSLCLIWDESTLKYFPCKFEMLCDNSSGEFLIDWWAMKGIFSLLKSLINHLGIVLWLYDFNKMW